MIFSIFVQNTSGKNNEETEKKILHHDKQWVLQKVFSGYVEIIE